MRVTPVSAVCNPRSSPQTSIVNVATAQCQYGVILVAASERGICDIQLGTDREVLVDDYRRAETSEVKWVADNEQPKWLAAVLRLAENPKFTLDHPLDIRGTLFQAHVWEALQGIPAGQTTTYGDLAKAIGKPKAYRAVGAACGANRLALAIPCHRALRKGSGSLDYRWGADIKQQILVAEASWALEPT